MSVCLTGRALEPASLAAIARGGAPVAIDAPAREQIAAAASLVTRAAKAGRPIYGVTTGLGPRVVEPVSGAQAAAFSLRTLRGRANGVGAPLPSELSRAAMAVRLNGLCAGGAGAGLNVAEGLAGLLNAGVHPIIPASGSIGAADLCLLAHMGLVLVGEGEAEYGGERLAGAEALRRAGTGRARSQGRAGSVQQRGGLGRHRRAGLAGRGGGAVRRPGFGRAGHGGLSRQPQPA